MFEIENLKMPGVRVVHFHPIKDNRGEFRKTLHREFFEKNGLPWDFREQFYNVSKKDVIRGMHLQLPPHDHEKMVFCSSGAVMDVLVDLRQGSPTYQKCESLELNAKNGRSLIIPKGVAHGFKSLSDGTIISYAVTTSHNLSSDTGVLWNSIPFDWEIAKPIISKRDEGFATLKDFKSPFKWSGS